MKKTIYALTTSILLSCAAQSQITITSANMPSAGNTFLYSNAKLITVGDYTTTGTNYAWHFDTLSPTSQATLDFKSGLQTPYSIMFGLTAFGEKTIDTVKLPAIPNIPAISITDVYNFYKKTTNAYKTEGLGIKLSGFPVPNFYTDEDELYYFPLTYGSIRDSSTFRFSTISTTLIPVIYIKQGYRVTEVDGWGTVTTPYGTENCLRVVTTQHSIDTLKGTITHPVIGTFPFKIGFPNVMRSYQWLTLNEKIPYLEVSGNVVGSAFNATQAKYRDNVRQFVGINEQEQHAIALSVYPNPSNNILTIITQQGNEEVVAEITDLQGKIVRTQILKNNLLINEHSINVAELSKGLYILNLTTIDNKQVVKFSVQ